MTLRKRTPVVARLAFGRLEEQLTETDGVRLAGMVPTRTDATIV